MHEKAETHSKRILSTSVHYAILFLYVLAGGPCLSIILRVISNEGLFQAIFIIMHITSNIYYTFRLLKNVKTPYKKQNQFCLKKFESHPYLFFFSLFFFFFNLFTLIFFLQIELISSRKADKDDVNNHWNIVKSFILTFVNQVLSRDIFRLLSILNLQMCLCSLNQSYWVLLKYILPAILINNLWFMRHNAWKVWKV